MQVTLFYDGLCPLCTKEMDALRKRDADNRLNLVDIQAPGFAEQYPDLDWHALNARIHAKLPDGTLVDGLDATHIAWQQVGKGWLYAPLRWPLIKPVADVFYKVFARHRYTISYWLTGQKRCQTCQIGEKPDE